jgi:hypothetical protein
LDNHLVAGGQPNLAARNFCHKSNVVLTLSLQAGLMHLILLRSGNAFFNQSLIVAAPLVVLIGTGGRWHFTAF